MADDESDNDADDKTIQKSSSSLKKVFTVIFKENIRHSCQTGGKESVGEMLKRHIKKKFRTTSTLNNLVFKRQSDGCAINLGLPADVLDKDTYLCSFNNKEKVFNYSNTRKYDVETFHRSWNMGFFYIKIDRGRRSQPDVGDIKNEVEKVRIDYLPKEMLYQALCKDGRLQVTKEGRPVAKKWYFKKDDQTEVPISNIASSYKGQCFTLYQKRTPDDSLPDVPTRPETNCSGGVKVPIKSSDARRISPEMPHFDNQCDHKKSFDANASSKSIVEITDYNDFIKYIKNNYNIDPEHQPNHRKEKKRISNIRKFFKDNYDNFALQHKHKILASEMKSLTTLFASVGAVVVEFVSGVESFVGTCFVTGSQFVITNKHVYDDAKKKLGFKDFYVDFEYRNRDVESYRYRFDPIPVVSSASSGELDYAILRLHRSSDKPLPPSLSQCGYCIPPNGISLDRGKCLTLIGHPGGSEKATDITCPIAQPKNLSEDVMLGLAKRNPEDVHVLSDKRRQTYDVGTFFHGSSGSPGILLRERFLIVLHCRGFHLEDGRDSVIEQGVMMSAILADVDYKIKSGILPRLTLKDIFDIDYKLEPMEVEEKEVNFN